MNKTIDMKTESNTFTKRIGQTNVVLENCITEDSIISPILANIYMNELDSYMAEYAEKFNCGNRRKINPAFKKKLDVCRGKEQRLKRNLSKMSEEEKEGLIAEIRELRRSLKSMPYSDQMDDSYKRICYIRYADDFLIGVIGSKGDAE